MNKAQFIAALAPHFNGSKKEAAHAVDIVFDTIVRNMSAGNDVMINDFGKFKKVVRKAPCPVLTVHSPEHEFIKP